MTAPEHIVAAAIQIGGITFNLPQPAKDVGASFRKALDRAEKAEAENERLRNALVEIAHTFTERSDGTMKSCSASFYQEVARAALAQKGGE